jgi:hypothetical protein
MLYENEAPFAEMSSASAGVALRTNPAEAATATAAVKKLLRIFFSLFMLFVLVDTTIPTVLKERKTIYLCCFGKG